MITIKRAGVCAVLLTAALATAIAQGHLAGEQVLLSVDSANDAKKAGAITCVNSPGRGKARVETAVWIRWDEFKTLKYRKGNTTLYQRLDTFDKTALKITGPHVKVNVKPINGHVGFVVQYSTDKGKTWTSTDFEAQTDLNCLPAGS